MTSARFITFEGGEGAGKSTQVKRLARRLEAEGRKVLLTREPGGAPGAEEIRKLLVTGAPERWTPLAETLLLFAARDDHLRETIRPALEAGKWVICDRFHDSTRAYQGLVGGVDAALIDTLEQGVIGATMPDLTLMLDLDPRSGLARADSRAGHETRFEDKGADFHDKLREAFAMIATAAPERCAIIDAAGDEDAVAAAIWQIVESRLLTA